MVEKDMRILKKIQNKEIDDEVIEHINESIDWYKKHAKELLDD